MSYPCTKADAHAAIMDVELSNSVGFSRGPGSSPILSGTDNPSYPTSPTGELDAGKGAQRVNTPVVATTKLRRKYAAS